MAAPHVVSFLYCAQPNLQVTALPSDCKNPLHLHYATWWSSSCILVEDILMIFHDQLTLLQAGAIANLIENEPTNTSPTEMKQQLLNT